MDDSHSWKKKTLVCIALAQEEGSTNVALPHLINVTIKTNHKLCVHYNASRETAWHLDNHVEFLITKKLDFMYPEELAHCSIIGLIWRERGNCIGNKAQQTVAHIFIATRATGIGFFNEGDLYIELVWVVKCCWWRAHTSCQCGEREENSFHHRGEKTVEPRGGRVWISNTFSNKFTWVNWNLTAGIQSST